MKKWVFVFFIILSNSSNLISQNATTSGEVNRAIDSLQLALKLAKHDTLRANLLVELSRQIYPINPDSSLLLTEQALSIIEKESVIFPTTTNVQRVRASALSDLGYLYNLKGKIEDALELYNRNLQVLSEIKMPNGSKGDLALIATTLSTMGLIYHQQGKPTEALQHFNRCLKTRETIKMPDGKIGDKIGIAQSLSNIATIYNFQGLVKEAIEYNNRSLKIKEELGDENGIATSLNNIGYIYYKQEQYNEAKSYYTRSLKIYEKLGNQVGLASTLNNIGGIYKMQKNYTDALDCYMRSIKINVAAGNKQVVAASYNNIGLIYSDMSDFKLALENYRRALSYYEEMKERIGLANTLCNIGYVFKKQNNLKEAFANGSKSLAYAQQVGFTESIERSAKLMSEIYELQGNGMQALKMHKLFILMRDSARGKENQKALFTREAKYEYEKRAAADSVKNADEQKIKDAQLQAQSASLKQEKTQRYALYGGLVLVAGFLIFVINRFRITNKQKKIIEEQKIVVDEAFQKLEQKNKEVLDSIHYAKRIQTALITSEKYIVRVLKKHNTN